MKNSTTFAILATALLALGGLAMAVEAKDGDHGKPGRREDMREKQQEKMEAAKERMKARCEALDNETAEKRCERLSDAAFKARRAGAALHQAIAAHQRIFDRVNATIERLESQLASGNLTANQTERIENRLEKLGERAEKLQEKIDKLQEKLEKLAAKHEKVREHVEAMKQKRRGQGSATSTTEAASTTTESATTSDTETTSASA